MAYLALAALDRTVSEFRVDPDRGYLAGLSAGGNGLWNLAYRRDAILPPDSGTPYRIIARRIRSLAVWIWHGASDDVVPVQESRHMAEALETVGAEVAYSELPGVGHDSWSQAFRSAELPRWLLSRRRSVRAPRWPGG